MVRSAAFTRVRAPRVSVGMPVYNGEQFLRSSVESILAQTFEDFELVISDNGSTDGTEEICREYSARDHRILYHRNPINRGLSWNFCRVAQLATGRYFRWQSYDDACYPNMLARCVDVLERRRDVVLTFGKTLLHDENGATALYNEDLDLGSPSAYERYRHFLWRYQNGALCNVLYGLMRTDVLRDTRLIGRFIDSDVALIGELALRGTFCEIQEPLFVRRLHPRITTRANPSHYSRRILIDPAWNGIALHPELRLVIEHLNAVGRAPIDEVERLRCYALLVRYICWKAQRAAGLPFRIVKRRTAHRGAYSAPMR